MTKQISQHYLSKNRTDSDHRFLTMDEAWIHHHDPKFKQLQ